MFVDSSQAHPHRRPAQTQARRPRHVLVPSKSTTKTCASTGLLSDTVLYHFVHTIPDARAWLFSLRPQARNWPNACDLNPRCCALRVSLCSPSLARSPFCSRSDGLDGWTLLARVVALVGRLKAGYTEMTNPLMDARNRSP
jgi:hypothetical protein